MVFVRVHLRTCARLGAGIKQVRRNYSLSAVQVQTDEAVTYPPILDLSYKAKKKRKEVKWHEEIRNIGTVEEKLFKLNMPKYYGWKCIMLSEDKLPYNALPQAQYVTRTHAVETPGLPKYYDSVISSESLDALVQAIRSQVEDAVAFEYSSRKRKQELNEDKQACEEEMTNLLTDALTRQVNRIILAHLAPKFSHIVNLEISYQPRIEASWKSGGIYPTATEVKERANCWLKEYAHDFREKWYQYIGSPNLQLRHCHPLKEFVPMDACVNPDLQVPLFRWHPRVLSYGIERRHVTTIPGFWPGDPNEFGVLSYHTGKLLNKFDVEDDAICLLRTQSILASYAWLLGQACYQGFSIYHDLTYPLTSQMVTTNGQFWVFSAYQLNTMLVHSEHVDENPKRNMSWSTEPMKLFDKVEGEKVHGFNDDVLKCLLKFYANAPEEKQNVDMKPYLNREVKTIAEIEENPRRVWLEKHYKHLVSNRPRARLVPEIYHWEKIYKIDNKTCPMMRKSRPFELGINPFSRRLDDHCPEYVPKKFRGNPTKNKMRGKWAKTYYP